MAEGASNAPKPAPKSRYGPSFDEIERRDPVQWQIAHKAWVSEIYCHFYVSIHIKHVKKGYR